MATLIVGYGYVGSALGALLRERGETVYALSRSQRTSDPEGLESGVRAIQADVTRPLQLPADIERIAYVVSPDGGSPEQYEHAYVVGLQNVLTAAPSANVVLTTSTAVYSFDDGRWVDETTPTTATGKAAYLLAGEELVAQRSGIALRLGGIYGPERNRIVRQVAEGTATLNPEPRYGNRIHRRDCATAIATLFDAPAGIYVGVDDDPADLNDTYRWIAEQLGLESPPLGEPTSRRSGNKRCSNTKLRQTGWTPRYPSYREGYQEALAAIRASR